MFGMPSYTGKLLQARLSTWAAALLTSDAYRVGHVVTLKQLMVQR